MDEALYIWIAGCAARNVAFSNLLIKQKAAGLQDSMNEVSAATEKMKLQIRNGWLQKFKKRHGLRQIVMHGEQASANTAAVLMALPGMREQLHAYSPDNVFNADKSELQNRLSPNRTIADRQLSNWPYQVPSRISSKVKRGPWSRLLVQFKGLYDTCNFLWMATEFQRNLQLQGKTGCTSRRQFFNSWSLEGNFGFKFVLCQDHIVTS